MTITQILYVLETARCRSFSRAAERLYISQPALSSQIKKLEEELGYEIFTRDHQGVSLTDNGKVFFDSAQPLAQTWHEFNDRVTRLKDPTWQKIRIGIGARAVSNGLIDLILEFSDQHPETDVTFITDYHDDAPKALVERRMDLALDRVPPDTFLTHDDDISVTPLLSELQCMLVSSRNPLSRRKTLTLQDLSGNSIISGTEETLGDLILQDLYTTCQIKPSRVFRSDDLRTSMGLIEQDKGISMGPASFTRGYSVTAVPLFPPTEIELCLMCLKENQSVPLIRQLRRYLTEQLKQKP